MVAFRGEYDVYDEFLFYAMTHDQMRNEAYRCAIDAVVTGWSCARYRRWRRCRLIQMLCRRRRRTRYAVELHEDALRQANEAIEELGLKEKIVLIHGESTSVQLPEKVDVCVSEILGTIGSSEGVITVLNDARRFLKDDGQMVPRKCVTRVAAVSLPEELRGGDRLTELPRHYVERVSQQWASLRPAHVHQKFPRNPSFVEGGDVRRSGLSRLYPVR